MTPVEGAQSHPGTVGAFGGGSLGVAVVWFAGNVWPKVALSAEAGAGIATVAASAFGFMARNGLAGIWRTIRYGSSAARGPGGA